MAETASKLIHNWQCYPCSDCYKSDENTRYWIWHSAVAPSDAAEKNRNMGAQLQSLMCTTGPKIFWKIYFLYDWCAKNMFVLSHFWTTKACSPQKVMLLQPLNILGGISLVAQPDLECKWDKQIYGMTGNTLLKHAQEQLASLVDHTTVEVYIEISQ